MILNYLIAAIFLFNTPQIFSANIYQNKGQRKIPNLFPTTYYIADEAKTLCTGRYRNQEYNGNERSEVLDPSGEPIATVCTRFFKVLCMEGTGVLKDRGQGKLTINWAGNKRFKIVKKCIYGLGVGSYCLLPYHTIAADLKAHKVGSIISIPRAKGLVLPDGSTHNGIFVVRDTGGAFRGIGPKRIDIFVGKETDYDNVFSRAGFHHRRPEKAYRLDGPHRELAIEKLKEKFPNLF